MHQSSSSSNSWTVDVFVEFSVFSCDSRERWRAGSEGLRESGGKDQWELAGWKEVSRDPQSWVIHHQMNKPHTHTGPYVHTHICTQADAHTQMCAYRQTQVTFWGCQDTSLSELYLCPSLKREDKLKLETDHTVCFSVSFTVIGSFLCCVFSSTSVRALKTYSLLCTHVDVMFFRWKKREGFPSTPSSTELRFHASLDNSIVFLFRHFLRVAILPYLLVTSGL